MPRSSRVSNHDAGENVAAELVGAEPVGGRGAGQCLCSVAGERVVGRQHGAERGTQREQEKQGERERGDRVFTKHIPGMAQCRSHASSRTRGSTRP
jgi:hypothetical protein